MQYFFYLFRRVGSKSQNGTIIGQVQVIKGLNFLFCRFYKLKDLFSGLIAVHDRHLDVHEDDFVVCCRICILSWVFILQDLRLFDHFELLQGLYHVGYRVTVWQPRRWNQCHPPPECSGDSHRAEEWKQSASSPCGCC